MFRDITLEAIKNAQKQLIGKTVLTPVLPLTHDGLKAYLPNNSNAYMKLELMQNAGSFKARGAYLCIAALSEQERELGVVAVSGGNHALAVSWAAQAAGVSAKVVVPKRADPLRIEGCRDMRAEVVVCDTIAVAFDKMNKIHETENRAIVHPFEAYEMSLGAATCGQEFIDAVSSLDIVIVPVGGGGLISGMAAAIRQSSPSTMVYGVEPIGADTMYRSFALGSPQKIETVDTIADSLGSPTAMPYSYKLARKYVEGIVHVTDDDLRASMRILNANLKILPEPACAASFAAMIGPLKKACENKTVGVIACGSNISLERFNSLT